VPPHRKLVESKTDAIHLAASGFAFLPRDILATNFEVPQDSSRKSECPWWLRCNALNKIHTNNDGISRLNSNYYCKLCLLPNSNCYLQWLIAYSPWCFPRIELYVYLCGLLLLLTKLLSSVLKLPFLCFFFKK